MRDQEKAAKPH